MFAHGIPGNVGGAVVMNAGAYGGEIKDVIKWAKVLTEDGKVVTLNAEELELGYRTSIVQKKNMIVLQMCIKVVMNAGAYGGEIKDVIKWAKVLTEDGKVVTLNAEEL
ncbi:FAD-binding protein, partial [Parabacteroides distasonis]